MLTQSRDARSDYLKTWPAAAERQMMEGYQRYRKIERYSYGKASSFKREDENRLFILLLNEFDPIEDPDRLAREVRQPVTISRRQVLRVYHIHARGREYGGR